MKYALSEVRKTLLALAVPFASILTSAVTEASDGGSTITQAEWVTAACTAVITGGGVFAIKNKPGKGQRRKAGVSETASDTDLEASGTTTPDVSAHYDPGP